MASVGFNESDVAEATIRTFCARSRRLIGPDSEVASKKLAMLCSLPRVLTPELVGYLRERFLPCEAPWELEADLLLNSEICQVVGREQFTMLPYIRDHLAREARKCLSEHQLRDIQFLITDYVQDLVKQGKFLSDEEAKMQAFWAMALTTDGREKVVSKLTQILAEEGELSSDSAQPMQQFTQELYEHLDRPADMKDLVEKKEVEEEEVAKPFFEGVVDFDRWIRLRGKARNTYSGRAWSPRGDAFHVANGQTILEIRSEGNVLDLDITDAQAVATTHQDIYYGSYRGLRKVAVVEDSEGIYDEIGGVRDVAASGDWVIACGEDGFVALLRTSSYGYDVRVEGSREDIVSAAIYSGQSSGTLGAFGSDKGSILLCKSSATSEFHVHESSINALSWNRTNTILATASGDRTVHLYQHGQYETPLNVLRHDHSLVDLSFSANDEVLATIDLTGIVRIWSCQNWELLDEFIVESPGLYGGITFHPTQPILASGAAGSTKIQFHHLDIPKLLAKPWRDIQFSSCTAIIFTNAPDRTYENEDRAILRQAFGGFANTNFAFWGPASNTFDDFINNWFNSANPPNLVWLHVCGVGEAVDGRLLINTSTGKFDLLELEAHITRVPQIRGILTIDARNTSFLNDVVSHLSNWAIFGMDLNESSNIKHGLFSYALTQAIARNPLSKVPFTLSSIRQEVLGILNELPEIDGLPNYVFEGRGLEDVWIGRTAQFGPIWSGKRILWVDNSPTNNSQSIHDFEEKGAFLTYALSTEHALSLLKRNEYDLIITDIGRPGDRFGGFAFLRQLLKMQIKTPRIVYSGRNGQHIQDEAIACGAVACHNDPKLLAASIGLEFNNETAKPSLTPEFVADHWRNLIRYIASDKSARSRLNGVFNDWVRRHVTNLELTGSLISDWLLQVAPDKELQDSMALWKKSFPSAARALEEWNDGPERSRELDLAEAEIQKKSYELSFRDDDSQNLYNLADEVWLGIPRTMSNEHRHALSTALRLYYIEGNSATETAQIVSNSKGGPSSKVIQQWLSDPAFQKVLAFQTLYMDGKHRAQTLLSIPGLANSDVQIEIVRRYYGIGENIKRIGDRFPLMKLSEIRDFIQDCDQRLPIRALAIELARILGNYNAINFRLDVGRRLVFQYYSADQLSYDQILAWVSPAADVFGFNMTGNTMQAWLSSHRLLNELRRATIQNSES